MSGCAHMNRDEFCGSCAPEKLSQARTEVERLKAEVADQHERGNEYRRLAEDQGWKREQAQARLAKVVKAADALLSYLQQLELLTYEPADWENPTVVEFKAALAAAKGE